jgi:EAL domain-containing protein (putative c-di-GMP-specific phosphodiesterase class I)
VLTRPDVLKLDRTLVDGPSEDAIPRTLVRSLVDFGHGSEALVVAEGVEAAEEAATLLALGVDHGQGWHFGRPGPVEDLVAADTTATVPAQALPSDSTLAV